jgi:ABC-type transporter Mla subunit MlaD
VPEYHNEGIHVSGGAFTGAAAVGPHAQAQYQAVPASNTSQLDTVIADLRQLTEEHRANLADAEQALRDALALAEETRRSAPDTDRVVGILQRLAKRGTALVAVGQMVEQARQIAQHVLG